MCPAALLTVFTAKPPDGFGAEVEIANDLTTYFKNDGARCGDDLVRAVLSSGVNAVHAMFAGMMYGIPAPGKKKDNHASAGTLRAYCQFLAVYTKYVELKRLPSDTLRRWTCPKTPTNDRGYLIVPTWVLCVDEIKTAKIDSEAIVEFFRSVYDGELHDKKPTHATFKTLKAAGLALMNYDCKQKKLDPLQDGLFNATTALKLVPQWQKVLERESNRKNVVDQETGEYAVDLHAWIKDSIWDHAKRAHEEMFALDSGTVKYKSELTLMATRFIWKLACVGGLRISDGAAVYWHHFFKRDVQHYGPDGQAVQHFITSNGKTNFGRNMHWSGMFLHRDPRQCAVVAGGELIVQMFRIENIKFPDFRHPREFRNMPVLTPESARRTAGMSQSTAAQSSTLAAGGAMMAKRIKTLQQHVDSEEGVIAQSKRSRKVTHEARNWAYHILSENNISNNQKEVMMRHGDSETERYAYGNKFCTHAGQALAGLGVHPKRCETPHGVNVACILHPNGDEQDSEGTRPHAARTSQPNNKYTRLSLSCARCVGRACYNVVKLVMPEIYAQREVVREALKTMNTDQVRVANGVTALGMLEAMELFISSWACSAASCGRDEKGELYPESWGVNREKLVYSMYKSAALRHVWESPAFKALQALIAEREQMERGGATPVPAFRGPHVQ